MVQPEICEGCGGPRSPGSERFCLVCYRKHHAVPPSICVDCHGPKSYGAGQRCRDCYLKRSVEKKQLIRLQKQSSWITFTPEFVYKLHTVFNSIKDLHPGFHKLEKRIGKELALHEEINRLIEEKLEKLKSLR